MGDSDPNRPVGSHVTRRHSFPSAEAATPPGLSRCEQSLANGPDAPVQRLANSDPSAPRVALGGDRRGTKGGTTQLYEGLVRHPAASAA